MPLKLFKRGSQANLKQEAAQNQRQHSSASSSSQQPTALDAAAEHLDTAYHSSLRKSSSQSSSAFDYFSSSFLPRIDVDNDDHTFLTMDFLNNHHRSAGTATSPPKKDNKVMPPLPPTEYGLGRLDTTRSPRSFAEHDEDGHFNNSLDDDDIDDDDTDSIQASPVLYDDRKPGESNIIHPPGSKSFAYQSSSSTLPSHFSNKSSASSSTTVDSINNVAHHHQHQQQQQPQPQLSKHHHTQSALSYSNPQDAETARQFWKFHDAANPSPEDRGINQDHDVIEEEDEPLFEERGEPQSAKERVKSMFPSLSFYKPLKNPDEDYREEVDVEDEASHGLVSHEGLTVGGAALYDGNNNSSVLSFRESKTEQELERKSLPPAESVSATSALRRSLASPVKSFNALKKKTSKTFSKTLVFNNDSPQSNNSNNNNNNINSVGSPSTLNSGIPSIPSVSFDTNGFGNSFSEDDDRATSSMQQPTANSPPSQTAAYKAPPPSAPLPPHLTMRAVDQESDDDEDDEEDDNLLPLSPLAPPTRSASIQVGGPQKQKMVMTKSQFDSYRKSVIESGLTNQMNNNNSRGIDSGDEDNSEGRSGSDDEMSDDDDEEEQDRRRRKYDDELDNKKQSIRMRLKQDAHLSVYRQKMTKVTGSQTALSSYNSSTRLSSYGNLDAMVMEDDDEYDDVPLGILQAHGFPGHRLRAATSTPNLSKLEEIAAGQGPSVLYRKDADAQSLRSLGSNLRPGVDVRASAPALPAAFNNPQQQMNRGLIGEIAAAEEAKQRRKSLGGMLNQRASNILSSSASIAGLANAQSDSNPMQQQMQQMMQMQMQILQQMSTTGSPNPQIKKHWSSFDIANMQQQQQQMMMMQPQVPMGRPASIRSFTPSERSMGSQRPVSMMGMMRPPMHQRNASQPALRDLANQELYRMSRSQTFGYPQPQAPVSRPASTMSSSMNLVETAAEDSDDEDDKAWEEMLKKRQGLKESWKNRGIAT